MQMAYLAAGNRKIGEYAVFLIFVSGVCLQAFALRIVPQFQCVVQCGRQNVFAIGREFHKRHRRIIVIDERLQALSTGRVPNAAQPVVAGGDDQRAVTIEIDRADRIGMGRKGLQTFAWCSDMQ